jgi:CRP/FNR family transcriptional regulator, dissimilatory nitrate respiration regulator
MNITDLLSNKEKKTLIIKSLKKDDVLFYELDLCECIGIILEGSVNITSYLEDGKQIIYNTINKDGIFGNNLLFSSNPYFKGDIQANCDTKIALIYKNNLIKLLQSNEQFLIEYIKHQSNFAKQLNSRIKLLSIDNAEERFYYYLHENNNIINIESVSELSRNLNLQRETVSRLLSKLIKENKIIKTKNIIKRR